MIGAMSSYAAIDGVLNVVDTVLARACNQNKLVRMLVQPFLYSGVISTFLLFDDLPSFLLFVVVDIAHVPLGDILGRVLCGGRDFGRRRRGTIRDLTMVSCGFQVMAQIVYGDLTGSG